MYFWIIGWEINTIDILFTIVAVWYSGIYIYLYTLGFMISIIYSKNKKYLIGVWFLCVFLSDG